MAPDFLDHGRAFLETERREHLTSTVTVQSGGLEHELAATRDSPEVDANEPDGLVVAVSRVEFVFGADDLRDAGLWPPANLVVVDTRDGEPVEFEQVRSSPRSGASWSFDDESQLAVRVPFVRSSTP